MYDYFICCDMFSIVYVKYYKLKRKAAISYSKARSDAAKILKSKGKLTLLPSGSKFSGWGGAR